MVATRHVTINLSIEKPQRNLPNFGDHAISRTTNVVYTSDQPTNSQGLRPKRLFKFITNQTAEAKNAKEDMFECQDGRFTLDLKSIYIGSSL